MKSLDLLMLLSLAQRPLQEPKMLCSSVVSKQIESHKMTKYDPSVSFLFYYINLNGKSVRGEMSPAHPNPSTVFMLPCSFQALVSWLVYLLRICVLGGFSPL